MSLAPDAHAAGGPGDTRDRAHVADRDGLFMAGDALRGGASIIVVLCHVYLGTAAHLPQYSWGYTTNVLNVGAACVFSFFTLSGYLVGGPFARRFVEGRPLPSLPRYFEKRARRILPAFWLILLLLIAIYGTRGASGKEVLAVFLFLQNQEPSRMQELMVQGWTLGVEVMFYLALPVVAVLAAKAVGTRGTVSQRRIGTLVFLALAFLVSFKLHDTHPGTNVDTTTLATFGFAIVPGIALAVLEPLGRPLVQGSARGRQLGLGLTAVGALALLWLAVSDVSPIETKAFAAEVVAGTGLLAGAMVWQWTTGRVLAPFGSRFLHAIGRWSLSIYLLHIGVGRGLLDHAPSGQTEAFLFLAVGMLGISIVGGALIWRFVEEPILLKRRPTLPALR